MIVSLTHTDSNSCRIEDLLTAWDEQNRTEARAASETAKGTGAGGEETGTSGLQPEAEAKKPQTYRWPGATLRDGSVADY